MGPEIENICIILEAAFYKKVYEHLFSLIMNLWGHYIHHKVDISVTWCPYAH